MLRRLNFDNHRILNEKFYPDFEWYHCVDIRCIVDVSESFAVFILHL
jgi:hypothetical protein